MSFHPHDTICAIASAAGGAARGMVRISGPTAIAIADRVFEPADGKSLQEVRCATALPGRLRVQLNSSPRFLPCDVFLWPTNRSYTREPLAELHTIGSRPLLEAVLDSACRAGARLAEPGEFTLRAFLAGRLDLTQAEAVLGVIDARGSEELDAALSQLAGGLAQPLQQLRECLLQMLAELEAGLDFVEEDIEFVSAAEILQRLNSAVQLLDEIGRQMESRHVSGGAPRIALVGPPNVGKSSLFNALVKLRSCSVAHDACPQSPAIVSPQGGTTRDYLTAMISLDGLRCEIIDTAGVDVGTVLSKVDAAAQEVAIEQRNRADIRAFCIEASDATSTVPLECDLTILTKTDLVQGSACLRSASDLPVVKTSSQTSEGLERLCEVLRMILMRHTAPRSNNQVVAITADRCRESIRLGQKSLEDAVRTVANNGGSELVAIELRSALAELGQVVGAVYTDDLLDRIFGTFCIGK